MKKFSLIWTIVFVLFSLLSFNNLYAKRNGITGRTNNNSISCGECHAKSPSQNVNVFLSSETGSFEFSPGQKVKILLTIQSPTGVTSGCNIAVKNQLNGSTSAGTLEPGPNSGLYLSKSELTHQQPKNFTAGASTYEFYWTAPTNPGTYYLQAVGLASNNNGKEDNNDIWNFAPVVEIQVKSVSSVNEEDKSSETITIGKNNTHLFENLENFELINSNINIFSIDGRIVSSIKPTKEEVIRFVQVLPFGVYFALYKIDNKPIIKKIMITE
ncbi:MAG: hypothetical protein CH6_1883 [Candidatus Kapaibacterium sp.]|nr:MAG: hypothetical protein CH6_1883 [Candidatus Kapabacteria bacterium]